MAKAKGSIETKITFGKRKGGKSRKSFNKHNKKCRVYRGQGR